LAGTKILKVQHVALTPPPVLLHPARGNEYVSTDLAPVHDQFPEAIPVDMHA